MPLSAYLLPHPSVFLDVLPIVMTIVRTDDILEAAEQAAVNRGEGRVSRKTGRPRRSMAGGYVRYFDLPEKALEAARSELRWWGASVE